MIFRIPFNFLKDLTLRARMSLWAAWITGIACILVTLGLYFSVIKFLYISEQKQIISSTRLAQSRIENAINIQENYFWDYSWRYILKEIQKETFQNSEIKISVKINNQWFSRYTDKFPDSLEHLEIGNYVVKNQNKMVSVQPLNLNSNMEAYVTLIADLDSLTNANYAFYKSFWLLLPALFLATLASGWFVSGSLLRPVCELESAAREIGKSGDLRKPLPHINQRDEIGMLAMALQNTFAQLADSRDREKDFARAAAHDLRSPLAALLARAEGSLSRERTPERYRQDLKEMANDLKRLSDLTSHLLLLSKDPSQMAKQIIDLKNICADAVDRARELDKYADIDFAVNPEVKSTKILGDSILLGQAIWNLIVNALKYSNDSPILVQLEQVNNEIVISVIDQGQGVDISTLQNLGRAFYRPDYSRQGQSQGGGHGLGLALAKRAAELHDGILHLESELGKGFTASIILPVYYEQIT